MDLIDYLKRQITWSKQTFGPGSRTQGIVDHIRKELVEIEATPQDLEEWVDVIILALDGAWREGHSPESIARVLEYKLLKNKVRKWPDWRTADVGKAIEHVRDEDIPFAPLARAGDTGPAHEAAGRARLLQGKMHAKILAALDTPAIASELMVRTGLHYNTLWRRLSELKQMKRVRNTKGKRMNLRGFNETIVERVNAL
jgi:hypothetical protein